MVRFLLFIERRHLLAAATRYVTQQQIKRFSEPVLPGQIGSITKKHMDNTNLEELAGGHYIFRQLITIDGERYYRSNSGPHKYESRTSNLLLSITIVVPMR